MSDSLGSDRDWYAEDHPEGKTCKFCGARGLFWHGTQGKFYLVNQDRERHLCDHFKNAALKMSNQK